MRNPTEYLKMRVLGAIDMAEGKTQRARIRAVSAMTFTDEDGNQRRFTWRTIETWLMRYNKHGVTGLTQAARSDKGKFRKVCQEQIQEAIDTVLPQFHTAHPTKMAVYRACIEQGLFSVSDIARNTFCRMVNEYEMFKPLTQTENKRRLAFAKAHANEMWQVDTMFGPHVRHGKAVVQSKLIAFIDDASRVCVHGQFFPGERVEYLIDSLSTAFYKRGIPQSMYADNGSPYCSKEFVQICARVGCILTHAPVRDGAAKGKVERFFRRVRDQFLCRKLDLSSLETLNRSFIAWVEEEYNAKEHSVLGMTPLDRFALDRRLIRYLPPNEVNEELFFMEDNRTVQADNTFSVASVRFEAPRHLPNRIIQVRFNRANPTRKVVVFYKSERMGEARPLDFTANDRHPSARISAPRETLEQQSSTNTVI